MATPKQLAANRRNALKSTGPKTAKGKAKSKLNALKHGILSREVVVRGLHVKESARELEEFRKRFVEELAPFGALEEMLVEQIVSGYWRLRRAVTAETGEIALSVDGGQHQRSKHNPLLSVLMFSEFRDPILEMSRSADGSFYLLGVLSHVREAVARDGELSEATLQEALREFGNKPNSLTRQLEQWRAMTVENTAERKEQTLRAIDGQLKLYEFSYHQCEEREEKEELARQAANVLPSVETLDKILRYETTLERQLYRAMHQLERLQRRRNGENIPAPIAL